MTKPAEFVPNKKQRELVSDLVSHFSANMDNCKTVLEQLRVVILADKELVRLVHSVKFRVKDPEHLRDKLYRKMQEATSKRRQFRITKDNLFAMITDLAGFRILHLHTGQMKEIDHALRNRLDEALYTIIEGPIARTWDDESRDYFGRIGIRTISSPSLYTSVHYVVEAASRTKYTCEIQVRTLAEELWGEVDHAINYPHPSSSVACREQIAALARVTSGCTRLVDAIFKSHKDEASRT